MTNSILNVSFETGSPAYLLRIWITPPYLIWRSESATTCKVFQRKPWTGALGWTPSGVLQISNDRDDWRNFGVWNFWFRDFLGWKILASIFLGSFIIIYFKYGFFGVLKTIWRLVLVPTYPGCVVPQKKILWLRNSASWDFLGVRFWSRDLKGHPTTVSVKYLFREAINIA